MYLFRYIYKKGLNAMRNKNKIIKDGNTMYKQKERFKKTKGIQ